jgi:hypothetical protein
MNTLTNPVFIDWLSTLGISVGTALIVAAILSLFSGRLLGLAPHYKLLVLHRRICILMQPVGSCQG